jgi:hypothetical protein
LVTTYPRLLHSGITYTQCIKNYCPILEWLKSNEAKALPINDYESYSYWSNLVPEQTTLNHLVHAEEELEEI